MHRFRVTIMLIVALVAGCAALAPTAQSAADRAAQMERLQTLLRDPVFARDMAQTLDAAYYQGLGQRVPPFLSPEEETATALRNVREEKIAISLAGFYAVETGVGYLAERDRQTHLEVLQAVAGGLRSDADMLLLARFANATWKAGQPFRALARIGRPTFVPAVLLSETELRKDFVQIRAAAVRLTSSLQGLGVQDAPAQLNRLQTLLRDQAYAQEMAQALDAAYYVGLGQPVPPFLKPEELSASTSRSVREEKIATNLAGFYALEAGVGILAERSGETPLQVVDAIARGTRPAGDMILLARLANATWKAGQPFRNLSRISRDTFKPAAMLSPADVRKDLDQIQAAAARLSKAMR